jgi:tRNA(Ile)-lysidine synthase
MTRDFNQLDLETRVNDAWPTREWRDLHVVLAVSGGPDSIAMLRAIVSLKEKHDGIGALYVAHLNHALRGSDAEEDQRWVQSLCNRFKVGLEIGKTDVAAIAAEEGDGLEAAARIARYDFFRRTAERLGARFVAVAHTADDQVETVLQRILRGTGIEGLAGMPGVRPLTPSIALVRPLLGLRRTDVLEYLAAIGQEYRTDATNQNTQWTRNRLRNELLPKLREDYNRKVDDAILRLAVHARDAEEFVAQHIDETAHQCVITECSYARIHCPQLLGKPLFIIRHICRLAWRQAGWPEQSMGFYEWQQLAELAAGLSGRAVNLPGNIRASREGDYLVIGIMSDNSRVS